MQNEFFDWYASIEDRFEVDNFNAIDVEDDDDDEEQEEDDDEDDEDEDDEDKDDDEDEDVEGEEEDEETCNRQWSWLSTKQQGRRWSLSTVNHIAITSNHAGKVAGSCIGQDSYETDHLGAEKNVSLLFSPYALFSVFLAEQFPWRDSIAPINPIVLPTLLSYKAFHKRSKKGRKRKQKNNTGKGPQATVAVDLNIATTAVDQSVVVGEVVSIESNVLRVAFADDAGREYGFNNNLFRISSSDRPVRDSLPSLATSGSA